ncbi:MAG: hypothetical protein JJE07_01750 [Flavobacteriaceae bacterium]|nr:hypothetical protein [Flavobacteriaceae bacterium]
MTLHKILKYVALVLSLIGIVFLVRILIADDGSIVASADAQESLITPFLWLAYITLLIIIVMVALFVVKGLFRGNIKTTLISIGAFVLVIGIAYVLTDGNEVQLKDGGTLSASGSHWVSAGLGMFYILGTIAVGAMFLSGVKKLIK